LTLEAGGELTTAAGNDLNVNVPSTRSLFVKLAGTTKVTMDNQGNVGIGTTSPGEKLDVQGNIEFGTGNIKLTYKSGSNPSCGKFTLARKWTQKTCSACSSCQTSAGWLSSDAPVCGYYMNFDAMCPCCADGAYCTADTWTEAICFD
jgi:hypothetical protein